MHYKYSRLNRVLSIFSSSTLECTTSLLPYKKISKINVISYIRLEWHIMLYEYALIFLGAAIPWLEVALVVPFGIVIGLSPFWVMVTAIVGNLSTVLALIFAFEKIKVWYDNRRKKQTHPSKRRNRAIKSWEKYGLPGLALLGPILIGTHIAAFLGLLFGARKKPMIGWMVLSIILWVFIFGIVTSLGFDLFTKNLSSLPALA